MASTKIALGKGFSVLVQKAIIHRVKMYQLLQNLSYYWTFRRQTD